MAHPTRLDVENLEDKVLMSVAAAITMPHHRPAHHHAAIVATSAHGAATPVHSAATKATSHPIVKVGSHPATVQNGLSMTLTTDRSHYPLGSPVKMTYTEANVGKQAITVSVGPSKDGFLIARKGLEVWRSNSGMQPMFLRLQTLEPGQSITFSATWTASAKGTFTVTQESAPNGPTATFTVS